MLLPQSRQKDTGSMSQRGTGFLSLPSLFTTKNWTDFSIFSSSSSFWFILHDSQRGYLFYHPSDSWWKIPEKFLKGWDIGSSRFYIYFDTVKISWVQFFFFFLPVRDWLEDYKIYFVSHIIMPGLPWYLSGKEPPANAGDAASIPGLGKSTGEGTGNPLQYSCLPNPMDRGAWRAAVHGIAKVRQDLATEQRILLRHVRTNVTTGSYI